EVVQDTQALGGVQLHALGAKGRKVGNEVGSHTRKIGAGLLNILLHHGDGDILFLHNAVGSGGFIQQHLVIFPPVLIPEIPLHGHEDGRFKVGLIHTAVIDGDFRHRTGIQGIEQ
ncbi:Cell division protein ZapA, partial [Dysosmobacter welbionis]